MKKDARASNCARNNNDGGDYDGKIMYNVLVSNKGKSFPPKCCPIDVYMCACTCPHAYICACIINCSSLQCSSGQRARTCLLWFVSSKERE